MSELYLTMRILFVTSLWDPAGAPDMFTVHCAAHYRLELPAAALQVVGGHDTALVRDYRLEPSGRITGVLRDKEGAFTDADVVVSQTHIQAETVRAAQRAGQVVMFDVTDLAELPLTHPMYARAMQFREAENLAFAAADAVTVSSSYLVDYIRERGASRVSLLRNPVYPDNWGEPEDVTDGPVLGWSGMIRWRADDCSVLRPWLGAFMEKHDLRFIHAGDEPEAPSFAEATGVDPDRVTARPLMTFADYVRTRPLAGVDIQLIPLMDHPMSQGKSCLKGLESAMLGIPFVASPSDEYRWLGCGRLAGTDLEHQTPRDWEAALEPLLDPTERERVAAEARERVASEDIRVRWKDWEQVYAEVLYRRATALAVAR